MHVRAYERPTLTRSGDFRVRTNGSECARWEWIGYFSC